MKLWHVLVVLALVYIVWRKNRTPLSTHFDEQRELQKVGNNSVDMGVTSTPAIAMIGEQPLTCWNGAVTLPKIDQGLVKTATQWFPKIGELINN